MLSSGLLVLLLSCTCCAAMYMQDTPDYDPSQVDWRSVVVACRESIRYERRLGNFYLRIAFHDSMSVTCTDPRTCRGADGSLPLSSEEQGLAQNSFDGFSAIASKWIVAIARWYQASIADTVAVCGAVAIQTSGGPDVLGFDPRRPFFVGRVDSREPSTGPLPAADVSIQYIRDFGARWGINMEEMVSLLGSHTLFPFQGCRTTDRGQAPLCNPKRQNCTNSLQMFTWNTRFYVDACTPLPIKTTRPRNSDFEVPGAGQLQGAALADARERHEMCKYSNPIFRRWARQYAGKNPSDVKHEIYWSNDHCHRATPYVQSNCPHPTRWYYTALDADLGLACLGTTDGEPYTQLHRDTGIYMRRMLDVKHWDLVYVVAYKKMMGIGASYSRKFPITGWECPSGWVGATKSMDWTCRQYSLSAKTYGAGPPPRGCVCSTEINGVPPSQDQVWWSWNDREL